MEDVWAGTGCLLKPSNRRQSMIRLRPRQPLEASQVLGLLTRFDVADAADGGVAVVGGVDDVGGLLLDVPSRCNRPSTMVK